MNLCRQNFIPRNLSKLHSLVDLFLAPAFASAKLNCFYIRHLLFVYETRILDSLFVHHIEEAVHSSVDLHERAVSTLVKQYVIWLIWHDRLGRTNNLFSNYLLKRTIVAGGFA